MFSVPGHGHWDIPLLSLAHQSCASLPPWGHASCHASSHSLQAQTSCWNFREGAGKREGARQGEGERAVQTETLVLLSWYHPGPERRGSKKTHTYTHSEQRNQVCVCTHTPHTHTLSDTADSEVHPYVTWCSSAQITPSFKVYICVCVCDQTRDCHFLR